MSTFRHIIDLIARDGTKAAYTSATASVNQLTAAQQKASAATKATTPTNAEINRQEKYTAAVRDRAAAERELAEATAQNTHFTNTGGSAAAGASGLTRFARAASAVTGVAIGAYAVRQAADWTIATATIGASALDVERSLTRLSQAYGVNGREIARQLVAISNGSMTSLDAMTQVNRALFAQNADLARDLPQIFAIARAAAIKSGEDVMRTYDSLILGILRGSYRLIDNADIYLRVAEITERWAASIGTTVDEMSIQERQIAVKNAILQDGAAVADAATGAEMSYAESIKAVTTAFTDLRREMGKNLIVGVERSEVLPFWDNVINKMTEYLAKRREFSAALSQANAEVGIDSWQNTFFMRGNLDRAAEILEHQRRAAAMSGREALISGPMRPAELPADAVAKTRPYVAQLQSLGEYSRQAEKAANGLTSALSWQPPKLWALYTPAMQATMAYRALAQAMREMTASDPADLVNIGIQALNAVESALVGSVGFVDSDVLSGIYEDAAAEIERITVESDKAGNTTFRTRLEVEEYVKTITKSADAWKDAGKESEKALNGVKKTLEDLYSEIESVATSGLEVTPQDVLDTQAGTYQDKALEPVRRLRDIVEKGLESPYAGLFKIPPEVLEQGTDAIKAWANRLADRGAALLDITLVDKDAFLRQWDEFQADVEAKKNTLATMAGWLVSSGRVSSLGEGKATAAKMLGIEDPEGAAKSVGTGLIAGITSADITGSVINHMVTEGKKREKEYKDAGGEIGKLWASGFLDTVKTDVGKVRSILAELLVPEIIARLPQGAPP